MLMFTSSSECVCGGRAERAPLFQFQTGSGSEVSLCPAVLGDVDPF